MSVDPRAVVRGALGTVLLAAISHTRADPDLWGHVLFGGDMLAASRIPDVDSYSFLADRPWINHEWLAECAMYLAYAVGGGPGLVALKVLVILAMLGLIWHVLRRQQVGSGSSDLLLALAVVGTFPQANHVRPQLFSLLAFAALVAILARDDATLRRFLLIPLLFAVWVNLHGGWIVGGGVLALWAASTAVSPAPRAEKVALFLAGGLALAATLANPYGWRMWQFLWSTVGFGRAEITDWQPVYRLGPGFLALWAVLALVAVAGAMRAWRLGAWELRRLAIVATLGLASLQVSRLLAFFAIAIVVLLGRTLAAALRDQRPRTSHEARQPARYAVVAATVIAAALTLGGAAAVAVNASCVRMGADQPEPEVVPFVQRNQLTGRLAVWFDWGEYAIWHLSPALKVSIDGRRETVYSEEVLRQHLVFYYQESSRADFLAEARPDHIWLPIDLPAVSGLVADGWVPAFRGPRSVWLRRAEGDRPAPETDETIGARCFPGP